MVRPGLAQSPQQSPQAEASWPALQGGPAHLGAAPGGMPRPPLRLDWRRRPAGDARMSSAVLAQGLAVVTGATRLLGFDPATGNVLWSDVERATGPLAPPAIDLQSGLVVFTEGNSPRNSAVVAVNLNDRGRRWRVSLEDLSRGGPTIADGTVFVGSRDRFIRAIDESNGHVLWRRRLEASVNGAPAVAGSRLFAASENQTNGSTRLYALDKATGKTLWSKPQRGVAVGVSSPTVADGKVFVGFGDAQVRAFDSRTGRLFWTAPVRSLFSFNASLAFAGGDVYAMDVGGGVYRFDGESGDARWDFQFPSYATWSAPLVVGSAVYVGMDNGTIACIDVSSGHLVWKTRLATGPIATFVPSADRILTTSNSARGALVAFRHDPSGTLLDDPSPTDLDLPTALLNYAGSFVLVLGFLVVLFRRVIRPRPVPELAEASDDATR
jgi:outer membrane protein assembly factor BamB